MKEIYKFENALREGIILKRPNRFVIIAEIDGCVHTCHCPCTGKIGNFALEGRPCLVSFSENSKRKTSYTVEAVSLNLVGDRYKKWIGINQTRINRYIEFFLKSGDLKEIVGDVSEILREQKLGNSKIDFRAGNAFVEVKMPLWRLQVEIPDHVKFVVNRDMTSHQRLLKHLNAFSSFLEPHQRAILLVCFMYDNPGFVVNKNSPRYRKIKRAIERGNMEQWQINLEIKPTRVRLLKIIKLGE